MGHLPGNTRFLHIGPHKTGTTAIQGAFNLAREGLKEQGLTYIGNTRQPVKAAQTVTGRPPMFGETHISDAYWTRLVKQVERTGDERSIISSEFFCEADAEAAERIISDLGGSKVHVIVTLRPLTKILAAQWQQYVQNGLRSSYTKWLDAMFNKPPYTRPNPTFWHRHQQGDLVARWAGVVGPENLTVIAVDDSDRGMLLRSFEEILDLPDGFLVADSSQENRSLTYGEAEIVRHFNREFKAQEWDTQLYGTFMRRGAVRQMKVNYQPTREEAVIHTPEWAMERAAKCGAESADRITALGVRVIGDLERLSDLPRDRVGDPGSTAVPPKAAAQAVIGAIMASGVLAPEDEGDEHTGRPSDPRLRDVTARQLARELLTRSNRKARRARKRFRRALGAPPSSTPATGSSAPGSGTSSEGPESGAASGSAETGPGTGQSRESAPLASE